MARTDKNNVTRYWWDSHIPGLSLMSADFTSHDYATHTHDAFVIAISELGSAKIKSRGTVETVHSTRLFVSNPEEPQSSSMAGSTRWRYRSIYLTSAGILAVAHGLGIKEVPYFTKNVIDDSNLVSCFGSLHRAFEAGADPFLRHELLICACERLFRGHGSAAARMKSAPRDRMVAGKAIELIHARFAEALLLSELAAAAGMSVFQLIGLFRRTVGTTPHVYLTHVRLNAACRLLRLGHSIAETAATVGFCDQSALTRHFKNCYGITPMQFVNAASTARSFRLRNQDQTVGGAPPS